MIIGPGIISRQHITSFMLGKLIGFFTGGGGVAAFSVLDSDGNAFSTSLSVLDSDGNSFTVSASVLDSDGNSFNPV